MAENERAQILAEFQAFTTLEDLDTCIAILEQHDWDLMKSVQSVMSNIEGGMSPTRGEPPPNYVTSMEQEDISPPPYSSTRDDGSNISGMFEDNVADSADALFVAGSIVDPYPVTPSTSYASAKRSSSSGNARNLNFVVEYRDRNIYLTVPDSEKIGKVKELLQEKLGVPADKQSLRGWSTRKAKIDDEKILRDLHLPKENTLFLLTPDIQNPTLVKPKQESEVESLTEALNKTYKLHITYTQNGKYEQFNLNLVGSKTVGEVKGDIYALTNLPARHQIWSGWPEAAKDDSMTLGFCGLTYPVHNLELTKANIISKPKREEVADMESEEEDDMNNVLGDDIFDNEESEESSRKSPLIPETVKDEVEALEHFTKTFRERYGECHPVFFVGSIEDAVKEALLSKAKDRKLLAVYLHHDASIFSNVFCSQILCAESVVNYLGNNFITWAWDMTNDTNSARLTSMAMRHLGNVIAGQVRGYKPDQFPVLLVITRSRSINEVVDIIPGSVSLDELMMRIMQDAENFHEQQRAEILEEDEREARERIRREQEEAFRESLAADRQKVEDQRIQQELEIKKQQEDERLRQEEEQRRMAIQESAALQIPKEPPENCPDPVSKLRFRMPTGEVKLRRFRANEPLKNLFFYITSEGFHLEDYKILTTFPRRDISQLDDDKTLEEIKLFPQETLILEEK